MTIERDALRAVRKLLRLEWNPIGIEELPEDEYDSYASVLFGLLFRGASVGEAARYLALIAEDHMSSPIEEARHLAVAGKALTIVDRMRGGT